MSTGEWLARLFELEKEASAEDCIALTQTNLPLNRLANYYGHLYAAAEGYVKDSAQREEQLNIVRSWQKNVEELASKLP